ncbi:MAG: hypothetical protein K2X82_01165 [Gemmataceae bacterium]|nr:hypothetical protein [Gemmataceae bacterium]
MRPARVLAFVLLAALALTAGTAVGQSRPYLAVRFGDKDQDKPTSPKAGHIAASGRIAVPKEYANPKVLVLIRPAPENANAPGWTPHRAKLDGRGWSIDIPKLAAGAYQVRVRCEVTRVADGAPVEVNDPEDPVEVAWYEVRVR